MNTLYKAYGWIVWVLSIAALFALFAGAILFTASLSQDAFEATCFTRTSLFSYLASVALLIFAFLAFFWLEKKIKITERLADDAFFAKSKRVIYLALAVFLFIWIISTQFAPVFDQSLIQKHAAEIVSGNFSSCEEGAYLEAYPFQFGLVWFSCLLGLFFGFNNFIAFQFVNAVAYICIFYCLVAFGGNIGVRRVGQICILLLAFLFYPFVFMVSFVYGNLIGLALSLLAILFELRFFDRRKIRYALVSALLISLAIFMKANYQVFLIAIILAAISCALKEKTLKVLIVIALSIFGFLAQGFISINTARIITGEDLDQGIGAFAYIAMGLHDEQMDRPDTYRAPGWYDNSTALNYSAAGFNANELRQKSIDDIKESINTYLDDPQRAAKFVAKKFVSQWCNPDFQCSWNLLMMNTDIERPLWNRIFTSEKGQKMSLFYLKALQLCVEFLALVCFVLNRKAFLKDNNKMLLLLIITGGLLCHMVWEGKAQYTVTYYVLLFPYAVKGAQDISERVRKLRVSSRFIKAN